jgi:hypothetical protein
MSTAVVFSDIEKAFDTTQHFGLLYKLSTLQFSTCLIKLTGTFLYWRKIKSFGRRSNAYAKRYTSRGVTRFCPVPHIVQSLYK